MCFTQNNSISFVSPSLKMGPLRTNNALPVPMVTSASHPSKISLLTVLVLPRSTVSQVSGYFTPSILTPVN